MIGGKLLFRIIMREDEKYYDSLKDVSMSQIRFSILWMLGFEV